MPVYKIKEKDEVYGKLLEDYELYSVYNSLRLPPDRIIWSKYELPEEIVEYKFEKTPQIIRLGFEFEFMYYSTIPEELWDKYDIEREYYRNMFELNNFFYTIKFGSVKEIYRQLLKIQKSVADRIEAFCREFEVDKPVFEQMCIPIQDGAVFNGMHLHLSFVYQNKKRYELIKDLEPKIVSYKNRKNATFRSIYSHHIWGAYRESEWRFKNKSRYQPIIYTARNTTEFRCFDYSDLGNKQMLKDFAYLLYKIYKKEGMAVTLEERRYFERLISIHGDYDIIEAENSLQNLKESL